MSHRSTYRTLAAFRLWGVRRELVAQDLPRLRAKRRK